MAIIKFVFVLLILVPVALAMKTILGKVIEDFNGIVKKKKTKR